MGKSDQYGVRHTEGPYAGLYTMLLCKVALGQSLRWAARGDADHAVCDYNPSECFQFPTKRRTLARLPADPNEVYDSITCSSSAPPRYRFNEYITFAKNGTCGSLPVALIVYDRTTVMGAAKPATRAAYIYV